MITYFNLKIEVNGETPFTSFSNFRLEQSFDWHHRFELSLPLDDVEQKGTENLNKSKEYIGKPIKFEFQEEHAKVGQFNGVITDVSISRHGGVASALVLRGYSPTIMLEHGLNIKAYQNQNLSGIVNSVTAKYPKDGINYKVQPNPNPTAEFTLQYKESCYNFLGRLANRYGQWFFFNGKDCIFGGLPSEQTVELKFGSDLMDFNLGLKLSASKFKTKAYDYTKNQPLEAGPAQVSNLDQLGKFAFSQSDQYFFEQQTFNTPLIVKGATDVNDIASARRGAIAAGLVELTGNSINPRLKVGGTISVKADSNGFSNHTVDYGTYTVISVEHEMDGMGHYKNTFRAIPSAVSVAPVNEHIKDPICETQPAQVTQNDDPDGQGRLKVKFYWQDGNDSPTPWVRAVTPNGGKNRGIYFPPEVGDEVLVSFEDGNPDRPIVIGSLYHGKASHSDRSDKDNHVKTIRTQSGNEIKFTDKSGEEEIMIMNKENNHFISLSLKDNKITIQSKGKIEMKAQEMSIETEKDLTIKALNIKVNADDKIGVKATKNLELEAVDLKSKGTKSHSTEGAQISVKADASLDIDGGATADIKAKGMMNISSNGKTSLQGTLVMIN